MNKTVVMLGGAIVVMIVVFALMLASHGSSEVKPRLIRYPDASAEYGVSRPKISGYLPPASQSFTHILFVGDGYTAENSLTGMLVNLANGDIYESHIQNYARLGVQSIAGKGARLQDWVNNSDFKRLLTSAPWRYVILQENEDWTAQPDSRSATAQALQTLLFEINGIKAQPLLFLTWQRAPGSNWRSGGSYSQTADMIQSQVRFYTIDLAQRLQIPVIAVGDIWSAALKARPSLPLYSVDNSSPSPTGTYLVALVLYHYFTNRPLAQIKYVPRNVDPADADFLRQFVQSYHE